MFDERDEDLSDESTSSDEEEEEEEEMDDDDDDEHMDRTNHCSMMSATSILNDSNPMRTQAPRIRSRRRTNQTRRDSDTDIDMDVLDAQTDIDTDSDNLDETGDIENNDPDEEEEDDDDEDDDEGEEAKGEQDMDSLFLSPPMRSSQSQQRFDIFSPQTFDRVMEDENTLQSTPKTTGSQMFRPRARRTSDMSD